MTIRVTGKKQFGRAINFFKKRENWNKIAWVAAENVADSIKDDAKKKLYERRSLVTGDVGESIDTIIARRGNNVYISLGSDHVSAGLLEFGGYVPVDIDKVNSPFSNLEGYADNVFAMTYAIKNNQPFEQGGFFMQRALKEGLPNLESEVMRTAHRMKP